MATMISAPDLTTLHEKLAAKLAELAQQYKVPGVAVGLYSRGAEDYAYHGVTSIENPLEVNADTLFQIGSTSKTFTATALMILAEQGRVDLSARVRDYIPELRLKDESVAAEVRVINLLNHTGGWVGDIFEDTGNGDDALARYVTYLEGVDQMAPLGTVASYNNAGVNIAGRIVEKVTGKTFEVAVRELVLEPLGLSESFYYDGTIITRRVAVGHNEKDEQTVVARNWPIPRSANPAGGIIATAADQIKYARFHLGDGTGAEGRRVLSRASLDAMKTPTFPLEGGALGDDVGISFLIKTVDGVRLAGHGGATNGQMAAFQTAPDHDFAVAVLTNARSGALLHRDLADWILEEYLGAAPPKDEPLDLSADDLAAYAGSYDGRMAIIEVTVDGDHLVFLQKPTELGIRQQRAFNGEDPPQPPPIPAKILAEDRFVVSDGPAKGAKGGFLRSEGGAVTALNFGGRAAYRVDGDAAGTTAGGAVSAARA
jgi:CubicO group peptidase (beta-lactamase class C family)